MDELGVHSFIAYKDDWKVKGGGNNCSFYKCVVSIIQRPGLINETLFRSNLSFPD